ncbi:MAG: prevent-host-death protein [Bacteroidales bacterium]|jgi:PHD/YefM family antitoxin component YafN of YafNO toxin-antitoxin module|nr:prevent-host-death protein [Bacteroidales bacterium]
MRIISTREFSANQRSYFELAEKERVIIKRGKKLVELVVTEKLDENPSPSGDPWFDNPENLAHVLQGIEDAKAGRVVKMSTDDVKSMLGL